MAIWRLDASKRIVICVLHPPSSIFKARTLLSNFCGKMIRRLTFTRIRAHLHVIATYHRRMRFLFVRILYVSQLAAGAV